MRELIEELDKNLKYEKYEIIENTIIIYAKSAENSGKCPKCGEESTKVHSRNIRKIQDLPMAGKKVMTALERRKFFCVNPECSQKIYAEQFEFIGAKLWKTKRLQDEIMRVSLTQSALSASKYLRHSVANVGKSTICNMLKKRYAYE